MASTVAGPTRADDDTCPPPPAVAAWVGSPAACVAVLLGLGSVVLLVAVAGRAARRADQGPSWSWFGLLGGQAQGRPTPGQAALEIAAVVVLLLSWGVLLRAGRALRVRTVVGIGGLWSAPLLLGPPTFSLDSYSYLAQGRLAELGLDPYRSAPSALGSGPWLHAVDPFWRHSVSPYGPLTTLIEHAVASTGSPLVAVVALHVLAWLSLAVLAATVASATTAARRSSVLVLVALNPLLLLQLLGAAHWEALMMALVAGALWSWQRGHPSCALALAAAAAAVKAPAAYVVAVLLVLHLSATPRRQRGWALALALGAAAAAPWLVLGVLVRHPWGFVAGLASPLTGRTLDAPTTLLAEALAGACHLASVPVSFDGLLGACRLGGLLCAALVCSWLLTTGRRRPAGKTIGLGLLAVAALGPVLYPWYLTWGLVPLAMTCPERRRLQAGLSAVACFTALPGCTNLDRLLLAQRPSTLVNGVLLLAAVLWWASFQSPSPSTPAVLSQTGSRRPPAD